MPATPKNDGAALKDDADIQLRLEVYDALAKSLGADTVAAQADLHGIGRQHMSEIRNRKKRPSLRLAIRMAADLGTTVEALIERRSS
jgi:DNA-binding XRE family transcriptional regulator